MSHRAWFLSAVFSLSLVACSRDVPTEECCTVEGVVKMCDEGVTSDVVISAIQASGTVHEPTPDEIIALHKACGDGAVIEAFRGSDAQAALDAVEAAQVAAQQEQEPERLPVLSLRVSQGSRGIEVFNTSGQPYTNLVLSANGEYTYRLPVTLAPGDGDYIRIASFKNRNGVKLDKAVGVKSLYIRGDQGEYSRRF